MRLFLFIVIAVVGLAGCEDAPPENLIDEETYERMFIEFAIINQLDRNLLNDSSEEELRNLVYEHYGVTPEQFRVSHQYYEEQIDEQIERLTRINLILRSERDTIVEIERKYKEAITSDQVDSLRQSLLDR